MPLTGTGLPNLQASEVARWGMTATDAPVGATAVFGPGHVPAATTTSTDWPHATITYFTPAGRTTNTAAYGAGQWLIDSTRYDTHGNTIWTLPAEGRVKALAETSPATAADKYATHTVYNTTGTRVETSMGPIREVVLEDGTTVAGRTITETDYDDETTDAPKTGRPTTGIPEGGYQLAVEQRTAVTNKPSPTSTGSIWDVKKVRYRYDPIIAGDKSGWDMRVPTRTLTQDGTGWATTITRYDPEGKLTETRSPGGTALSDTLANDPYTIRTIYYTADNTASVAACRNRPEWRGNLCQTSPAANPATGHPIPATATTGYSLQGGTTRAEETSAGHTRATVTVRDYLDRETSTATSLTGHTTITATTTYDPTTGAVTTSTGNGHTEQFTYDTWGRQLTGTDGTGNAATTSYDTAGRTKTFNDGKGVASYTYDSPTEHRGLVTAIDLGYADDNTDQITGTYDIAGNLAHQTLPGGHTQTWTRDITGRPTALTYKTDATTVAAFTQTHDHLGRVRTATGPAGTRTYRYDDRARLVQVNDNHLVDGCTVRKYTFTGDSNRTKLATHLPASNRTCQTNTAAATQTHTYDQADRITDHGYHYDQLGRTLTIPAAHTTSPAGASDLTITYHANDMVATLTQTTPDNTTPDATGAAMIGTDQTGPDVLSQHQTFTLDASDRISKTITTTNGAALTETTNHYDSSSDNPAWTQTRTRPDPTTAWKTTWNRYLSDLGGSLAIDLDNQGVATLQISNLHGDIVATTTLGQTGLTSHTETDEYGNPTPGATTTRYGWLGTHQRDTATLGGLVLMGARLYTPTTGRFLSIDPITGGNDNRYTYPADPINKLDLDGQFAAIAALFFIPGVGQVLLVLAAGTVVVYGAHVASKYIAQSKSHKSTGKNAKPKNTRSVRKAARAEQKNSAANKHAYKKKNPHTKTSNGKGSLKSKHDKGVKRTKKDRGGEAGDQRRRYRR